LQGLPQSNSDRLARSTGNGLAYIGARAAGCHSISWRDCFGQESCDISLFLERGPDVIRLRLNKEQLVLLHSTPMRFGGVRWWFSCPRCSARCAKLYRPKGSKFLCRICHDLTYQSCMEGKSTDRLLASVAANLGVTLAAAQEALARGSRTRGKWRRKRDRRPTYKGRGWRLRQAASNQ
jgi:hypothetical protein